MSIGWSDVDASGAGQKIAPKDRLIMTGWPLVLLDSLDGARTPAWFDDLQNRREEYDQ
jgi:hypothetical protein